MISQITDSAGVTHVVADRRYLLHKVCDLLQLNRKAICWSMDLRCYVLAVRRKDQDKQVLQRFFKRKRKG